MIIMKLLTPLALSREDFQPFGEYVKIGNAETGKGFFPDLMQLPMGSAVPTISLAQIGNERMVTMLEYHKFTSEGLMPLDGDCDIVVGRPVPGNPFRAELKAFRVPSGTFVRLNPGVVHGSQYSITGKPVNVLLILPAFTFGNDTEFIMITNETERFEIQS